MVYHMFAVLYKRNALFDVKLNFENPLCIVKEQI